MNPKCKSLNEAVQYQLNQRNLAQAAITCRELCATFPGFAPGWHKGSILATTAGSPDKALDYIDRAIELDPDTLLYALHKVQLLLRQKQRTDAANLAEQIAARCQSNDVATLSALAVVYTTLEDHRLALDHYARVVALEPTRAINHFNLAATQRFLGNLPEAEQSYDDGLCRDPHFYEAYQIRSSLRTQSEHDNHIPALQEILDGGVKSRQGEIQICYALAKELEDIRDYKRSFSYLKRGANLCRSTIQYRVEHDVNAIDRIIETFSARFFERKSDGHPDASPIFILGLPRTGTTLVERILSSHSDVHAAGELNVLATEIARMTRPKAPGTVRHDSDQVSASANINFRELGQRYLTNTRSVSGKERHFTDKMPLNYLHCGLIALALPQAKIVELHRHPIATCYSIYKHLFNRAYPFSYDLAELGSYYLAQQRLMSHWHSVLPNRIYRIHYEDLVLSQQNETEKLLQHCALEWQDDCLDFDRNTQASTTASAAQIRKPVYKSSLDQWQNYSQQLQPLVEIFTEAGIDLRSFHT